MIYKFRMENRTSIYPLRIYFVFVVEYINAAAAAAAATSRVCQCLCTTIKYNKVMNE